MSGAVTPVYGLRYQLVGDPPDGPDLGGNGFLDVETQLVRIDATEVTDRADLNTVIAESAGRASGLIAQTSPTASTATTTAETIHASVTGTLTTGRFYRVCYRGQFGSTVAGDLAQFRYRIASGASVTTAGTQLRTTAQHADTANRDNGLAFDHIFTVASAGQWTVGISIQRNSGTGTVKLDYVVNLLEPLLTLEDLGT